MKKIFKGIAILAASAALCIGVAATTGCNGGNGDFEGSYSYENYGQTYGMSVKVSVKNNIITNIEDTTAEKHADWHVVSPGWEDYRVITNVAKVNTVDYKIVTKGTTDVKEVLGLTGNFMPTPFTFKITVVGDTITKYEIVTNGSADRDGNYSQNYADKMPESFRDGTWFVGKNLDDILKAFNGKIDYDTNGAGGNINTGLSDNDLSTGASQSDYICLQAAAFAIANAGDPSAEELKYTGVIDLEKTRGKIVDSQYPEPPAYYKWSNASVAYWNSTESYLLQQYIGLSVDEVLAIHVFTEASGQPYAIKDSNNVARNPQLEESGLLVTGATQSSGRLLLAIQNALGK